MKIVRLLHWLWASHMNIQVPSNYHIYVVKIDLHQNKTKQTNTRIFLGRTDWCILETLPFTVATQQKARKIQMKAEIENKNDWNYSNNFATRLHFYNYNQYVKVNQSYRWPNAKKRPNSIASA